MKVKIKDVIYEFGCRNNSFRSKEEVCLNNKFSEYRTLQEYLVSCPPQIMEMKEK